MYGSSIVGFGSYQTKYADGHTEPWPPVAFSPRKTSLTLYIASGYEDLGEYLSRLGKHKTAKVCLYIKRLDDIDLDVLHEMIQKSLTLL